MPELKICPYCDGDLQNPNMYKYCLDCKHCRNTNPYEVMHSNLSWFACRIGTGFNFQSGQKACRKFEK